MGRIGQILDLENMRFTWVVFGPISLLATSNLAYLHPTPKNLNAKSFSLLLDLNDLLYL